MNMQETACCDNGPKKGVIKWLRVSLWPHEL